MEYKVDDYISATDLSFTGVLSDIKKSKTALQPVFEAFTNALEAVKIKSNGEENYQGEITINIFATENTLSNTDFNSLEIIDNGVGFTDEDFKRFNTFKDQTKGFKNLGSGRLQFVHHFDHTTVVTRFNSSDKFFERKFTLSKREEFISKNSIVFYNQCKEIGGQETGTTITFRTLLENSVKYNNLNADLLKEELLKRYIHYFCHNKNSLPVIEIKFFIQSKLEQELTITDADIPNVDKIDDIQIPYSKISSDGKSIEKTDELENFNINAFKIPSDLLTENDLKLVSKGEVVEDSEIILQSLSKNDRIKGFKYLFLVASAYIDKRDSNMRGILKIPDFESFSKNGDLFTDKEILIEDIQSSVNEKIDSMYPEIEEVKNQHKEQLTKLKEMFLLDDEAANEINISINDTEVKILEKFYEAEAKKVANKDSKIKESIDRLDCLDTTSPDYSEKLYEEVDELVKSIPIQNRRTLTHYVARRKLVLELFDKILDQQLNIQTTTSRNIDEKLLHNLIFQQSSTNPEQSDLWLINEDFIYFKGTSEERLKDIEVNGVKLLRENLTDEESKFRLSLGEDRYSKRPDILLFPDEGKCIIIEFKNPNVSVSDHLNQINNYATLIWNFSVPNLVIDTFYGYLIGEKIDSIDVRFHDGEFKEAYNFDYLFRPHKNIIGLFSKEKKDAALYTEVIKYSTLLGRAKSRNNIFIKKLTS